MSDRVRIEIQPVKNGFVVEDWMNTENSEVAKDEAELKESVLRVYNHSIEVENEKLEKAKKAKESKEVKK